MSLDADDSVRDDCRLPYGLWALFSKDTEREKHCVSGVNP